MHYNVNELSSRETYQCLTNLVAPRPIALASTIDREGNVNLSPFSFFNLFSSNPPIVIFSPLRRMRDDTRKHTLYNVIEVPEVVINIVTKEIVGQTSLASCEYEDGVDEFLKGGFKKERAIILRPPMVQEAKAKLECRVTEIKPLGQKGGAGNLIICKVLSIHLDHSLFNKEGHFDPHQLHLVARLGGNHYCEVNSYNLFSLPKPDKKGIGIDALPEFIRQSDYLTGNELAVLASVEQLPIPDPSFRDKKMKAVLMFLKDERKRELLYQYIRELIDENKPQHAWQVLFHSREANQLTTI
jgi:flavin reductase (DIM6/NTAB) family NADH-FMN oxidoreductase RutF